MTLPPDLHKAILAGTARVPFGPAGTGDALAPLLATLTHDSRLWHTICAADLWQRAGFAPPAAAALPAAAGSAAAARCSAAAAQQLQLLLRGINASLLGEWLRLAANAGQEIPHEALVPVMELGLRDAELRSAIGAVLGERGAWLASRHPQWRDVYLPASTDPTQEWELGTLARRVSALQHVRRTDPAAGLAMLAEAWPQEPPEHRAELLPVLAEGLSLADEAFLEQALDDKRKEVRAAARTLLIALPGAQLRQRCAARLDSYFRLSPQAKGQPSVTLEITLPDKCDKIMKRDGAGSGYYPGLGEKATWLADLMQAVPPARWSDAWELAPDAVLAIMGNSEFKTALVHGLINACAATHEASPTPAASLWITTLLHHAQRYEPGIHAASYLGDALHTLAPDQQDAMVRHWLDQSSRDNTAFSSAIAWCRGLPGGCVPAELSQRMLATAQRLMRERPQQALVSTSHLAHLARVLNASDIAYVHRHWPGEDWEHWPQWRGPVSQLIETMEFRHTMQESFTQKDDA